MVLKVLLNFSPTYWSMDGSSQCDMSQEPNGTCSEQLVQMNFLFWLDFIGWILTPRTFTAELAP